MKFLLKYILSSVLIIWSCDSLFANSSNKVEDKWVYTSVLNKNFEMLNRGLIRSYLDSLSIEAKKRKFYYALEVIELVNISYDEDFNSGLQRMSDIHSKITNGHSALTRRLSNYYMFQFLERHKMFSIADKYLNKVVEESERFDDRSLLIRAKFDVLKRLRRAISEEDYLKKVDEYYFFFLKNNEMAKALHCYALKSISNSALDESFDARTARDHMNYLARDIKSIDSLYFPNIYLYQEAFTFSAQYNVSDSILNRTLENKAIYAKWFYPVILIYELASNDADRIKLELNKSEPNEDSLRIYALNGLEHTEEANCLLESKGDLIEADKVHYFTLFHNYLNAVFYKTLGQEQKVVDYNSETIAVAGITSKYNILAAEYFENQGLNELKLLLTDEVGLQSFRHLTTLYEFYKQSYNDRNTERMYAYFALSESKALKENISISNNIVQFQRLIFYFAMMALLTCILLLLRNKKIRINIQIKNDKLKKSHRALRNLNSRLERQTVSLEKSKQGADFYMKLTSQDLKSPVRNISQMLELVRMKQDVSDWNSLYEIIDQGTKYMYNLVSDMQSYFELAVKTNVEFEPVDLKGIISAIQMESVVERNRVTIVSEGANVVKFHTYYLKKSLVILIELLLSTQRNINSKIIRISQYHNQLKDIITVEGINFQMSENEFQLLSNRINSSSHDTSKGGQLTIPLLKQIVNKYNSEIRFVKDENDNPCLQLLIPDFDVQKILIHEEIA